MMQHDRHRLLALIMAGCLLLLAGGAGAAVPELTVPVGIERLNLNSHVSYAADIHNQLTAENISQYDNWKPNQSGSPVNLGFTTDEVWIRLVFKPSNVSDRLVLALPYPLLEQADIYIEPVSGSGKLEKLLKFGYLGPGSKPHRYPAVQLPERIRDGGVIYLAASSATSLQLPLELWASEAFADNELKQVTIWGAFYGLLAGLLIYNFFLLLSTLDKQYLCYVLYLGSLIIAMLPIAGFDKLYLWNGDPHYSIVMLSCGVLLSCIFGLLFGRFLLFPDGMSSTTSKLFAVVITGLVGAVVVSVYLPEIGARVSGVASGLSMFFIMTLSVYALQQGVVVARYFLAAWLLFSIGLAIYLFNVFGILSASNFSNYAVQIGSAAEVLLLSFALAYRIKEDRRRRIIALEEGARMAEKIKTAEIKALESGWRDSMTERPNEFPLIKRMAKLIRSRHEDDHVFAVLYLRLPQCRSVSFSLGSAVSEALFKQIVEDADEFLITACNTVQIEPGQAGFVCVPEFGSLLCLLRTGKNNANVHDTADALQACLNRAYDIDGISIHVDAFCGMAFYPTNCDSPLKLIQRAGSACENGIMTGQSLTVHSSAIESGAMRRLQLIAALAQALESGEFSIVLQPQIDLATYRIVGAEVLARWQSPRYGSVSPDEFIPLAESANLIHRLTMKVIDKSIDAIAELRRGAPAFSVSINISVHNLTRASFADEVIELFAQKNRSLEGVTFEVTESTLIESMQSVLQNLNTLVMHGARLAIDDFGTGYSSFSYLSQLPIHELKVDKSFVEIKSDGTNRETIVETIMKLASTLSLETVVEGIEDGDTLERIAKLGADRVQGYYFGLPLTLERFQEFAQKRTWFSGLARSPGPQGHDSSRD